MANMLDQFIERGNLLASPIIDDRFRWQGQEWLGVIGDLARSVFFDAEAIGKKESAERRLECRLSQFPHGTRPQIGDMVTDLHDSVDYRIVEELSIDTTNAVYAIRKPMVSRRA